jgi:transcriptional regulator with XRE-family HTH domain
MNELPNTLANKLSLAVFKVRKADNKNNNVIAKEIGISPSQLYKLMNGEVTNPKKIIAKAIVEYFGGEITMKDLGHE